MRTRVVAAALLVATVACRSPVPAPTSPTSSALNIAGAWNGTGSDPQGAERMSWMVAQTGTALSGTADLAPLNAADGTCASCHKFKTGTISGSLSGTSLAMRIVFFTSARQERLRATVDAAS